MQGGATNPRAALLACDIIWVPRDLPGDEPYVVLADAETAPFFEKLLLMVRGEKGFRGVVVDAAAAAAADVMVVVDGPTWHRHCETFSGLRPGGRLVQLLLYFNNDPSGFWDFAIALGDRLPDVFARRTLGLADIPALDHFTEHWSGARMVDGRLTPLVKYYGRDFRRVVEANGERVARVMRALADEESRATYARILFATNEQVLLAFSDRAFGPQQYMDIVRLKPGDTIVNCGVGSGWELPYFLCRLGDKGEIHNFDTNIVYPHTPFGPFLGRFADMLTDHPMLLSDADGELKLPQTFADMVSSDATARAGQVKDAVYVSYPCRMLDTYWAELGDKRIDYLKMDVEGGEMFILRGAMKAIRKHRPKLAVALYHEIEHFWEYPLYLIEQLQGYRFYLRQYGYSRFETLLYCVPEEDAVSMSGAETFGGARAAEDIAPPEQALFRFRDRESDGRRMYHKVRRPLTRFRGPNWRLGEITPDPEIDADTVVGVFESGSDQMIVTRHLQAPDNCQLIVGGSSDGVDVRWTANIGVDPAGHTLPVFGSRDACHLLDYLPGEKRAHLLRYDATGFELIGGWPLGEAPVAADMGADGVITVHVARGDGLHAMRLNEAGAGEAVETKLPGKFVGPTLLRPYAGDQGWRRGWMCLSADGGLLAFDPVSGAQHLISAAWDERLEIIPTIVLPEGSKLPMGLPRPLLTTRIRRKVARMLG